MIGLECEQTKKCNSCKEVKTLDLFSRHKTTKDGRRTYCKACAVKISQRYHERNPEWYLIYRLKNKYGLTYEEYLGLLDLQKNCCAICYKSFLSPEKSKICVDHSHNTGKVRGLLCFNCNVLLGHVDDQTSVLINAVNYLNKGDK